MNCVLVGLLKDVASLEGSGFTDRISKPIPPSIEEDVDNCEAFVGVTGFG